ncbi:MAG: phage holin family protein [Rhabdochlamydiaceae bacterium]|nr:phage holin family protein [Candidatus Amphrikana amoebophyrae]
MLFLLRLLVTTVVIVITAHVIPGLIVPDFIDALIFGVILGVINSVIRPILVFLTLPISVVTLGLFTLVINGFTFWLAATISYGVHVTTVEAAVIGGCIIWVTSLFTNRFIWKTGGF